MTDLAAWLLDRIAADEEVARDVWNRPHLGNCNTQGDVSSLRDECDCGHPARVLAGCASKRAIVELHELVTRDYAGQWWTDPAPPGAYVRTGCANCTSCGVDGEDYIEDGPCMTLRHLAAVYSDRDGYDPAWAVE